MNASTTYIGTFERKEVKYRLDASTYERLRSLLASRLVLDEACASATHVAGAEVETDILSLYFDTPDRSLIARSLEKPLYKEKLRLRSYGRPRDDDRVFLEIKKKMRGVVYKRRVPLSYAAARLYTRGIPYREACALCPLPEETQAREPLDQANRQIASELSAFSRAHRDLSPSMGVAAKRLAFSAREVRITFDFDVRFFDCRAVARCSPAMTCADAGLQFFDRAEAYVGCRDGLRAAEAAPSTGAFVPLLPGGTVLMEVKAQGSFPLWLTEALSACRIYPSSFSKYGEAYRRCVASDQGWPGARLASAQHAPAASHAQASLAMVAQ